MAPQNRSDPLTVGAIDLAQPFAHLPGLDPPAVVQDEARPVRVRHHPVDVAGDEQPDAGLGIQRLDQAGFQQRGVLADAFQIQRGDDPLTIAEMVIEAADAGAGTITNHLDGGRLHAELGETGECGLKDFLLAATTGPSGLQSD